MANMIPPELMLELYSEGLFPMTIKGEVRLFSPDPRGIIPLEEFRIPHGTRKTLRDPAWEIRLDTTFDEVVIGCAEREETWIDEGIFRSYVALHRRGHAHSLEVWRDGTLAGGLYGVTIGAAFFGESMFHRVAGASKVAICYLVEMLRAGGFQLLDTQWVTPHLEMFGARQIRRDEYIKRLGAALQRRAFLSL